MKYLCICQYGHSRSVALAREFHRRGLVAVAMGHGTGGDAIVPLSEWADVICLMTPDFAFRVPDNQRHKIVNFDIGPDRWSNPYNQELAGILKERVQKFLDRS